MIKYKANVISFSIKKIEAVRETEKFVVLKTSAGERKEAKRSEYECYFNSFIEARFWICNYYAAQSSIYSRRAKDFERKAVDAMRMVESYD